MEQAEKEYRISQSLESTDIGSVFALRKEVIRLAKNVGYRTGDFYLMPKRQLKAVYYNLLNKKNATSISTNWINKKSNQKTS